MPLGSREGISTGLAEALSSESIQGIGKANGTNAVEALSPLIVARSLWGAMVWPLLMRKRTKCVLGVLYRLLSDPRQNLITHDDRIEVLEESV
jgi:hypothetical protein